MSETEFEFRIAKLALAPGDILVAKIDAILSRELSIQARLMIEGDLPQDKKIHVLVIDNTVDLSVLTAAEIAERSA